MLHIYNAWCEHYGKTVYLNMEKLILQRININNSYLSYHEILEIEILCGKLPNDKC